jgi:cytochrome c biogenesis protein CcmG, thiol:disulfide interchange protein DsbE
MRYAIPALVLLALIVLFAFGLRTDPRVVPSPLIGKPAPAFALPQFGSGEITTQQALQGRPLLVNFFASWCTPCLAEHPLLMRLAGEGVEIVGMSYKDEAADAQRWLERHGNPYRSIIVDRQGHAGLDFGVYGVPETFVLDARGTIVYKQIGPITEQAWNEEIAPRLRGGTPGREGGS